MKKLRKIKPENVVTQISESTTNQPALETPQKLWYLYLIECQDGTYYAGITTDIAKRYQTHVIGKGAKYTRAHKPKRLIGAREYVNRSEAAKAEWAIKQLDKREKPRFFESHGS